MENLTPEQIVEKIKEGSPLSGGFDEWEGKEMIKECAQQKCKEQKQKIIEHYKESVYEGTDKNYREIMIEAPEPEFEW